MVSMVAFATPSFGQLPVHDAIRDSILAHHPGPIGPESLKFLKDLQESYENEKRALGTEPLTPLREYFSLLRWTAQLRDPHLTVQFKSRDVLRKTVPGRWPHFLVLKIGREYRVRARDPRLEPGRLPPINARLKDCDGRSVSQMFEENIFPFYGDPALQAHRATLAWRLFWDNGNPFVRRPSSCRFWVDGKLKNFVLSWQDLDIQDHLARNLQPNGIYVQRPFEIVRKPGLVWVSLPSFAPSSEQIEQIREIADALATVPESARIVFDLRGNTGGDSDWGELLLSKLYGERFHHLKRPEPVLVYRVSKENLAHWESVVARQNTQFGSSSHFSEVVSGMRKALASGQQALEVSSKRSAPVAAVTPSRQRQPRAFALTDGFCFSACLSFLDLALPLGVQHLGQETGADRLTMDVRTLDLPGGIFELTLPLMFFKSRTRGDRQSYRPKIPWSHDIQDAAAIEKWIRQL